MAKTFTQKTGPFTIQLTSDEAVDFSYIAKPYAGNNFNAYYVNADIGNQGYEMEIQDYGQLINIDNIDLTTAIINFFPPWSGYYTSWEPSEIGGKPGLIGIREKGGTDKNGLTITPGFLAAYSPDGFGNRGSTIAIIDITTNETNFRDDKTKFENNVKDIRILKTG